MKKMLLRFYPARWRARYGAEFESLLNEGSLGPADVADIVAGAFDAHLHFRGLGAISSSPVFGLSRRIGGYAALWAGILWLFALLSSSIVSATVGTELGVLAVLALSPGRGQRRSRAARAALALAAISGALAAIGGASLAIYGWTRWDGPINPGTVFGLGILAVCGGSALFAYDARRARSVSSRAAGLMLLGSTVTAIVFGALFVGPALGVQWIANGPAVTPLIFVSCVLFSGGWVAVGIAVLVAGLDAVQRAKAKPV